MPPKRSIPVAVWVFLLAFAVRLLVVIRLADSAHFLAASGDMRFYSDWALKIAHGHFTDHKAFYGLPGYAFFLGAIFAMVGFNPFAAGFLQAGSEAGIATLIFLIGRQIVSGSKGTDPSPKGTAVGGLAALGWIFFQPAQAFSAILMPTTWLVLAYWGIIWWSIQTPSQSPWRPWLWIGILTGVVSTMVATILFVLPMPAFAAIRNTRKLNIAAPAIALMLGGVLLGTAPCWLHNYFIAGEPVLLSAHSGVNFWIGNNPRATGYPKMPPGLRASQEGMLKDSIRVAETAVGHSLTRSEVSGFWSEQANRYIHTHPKTWAELMGRKVRNLWSAFQYDDLSIITALREDGVLTPGIRFGLVAALAIPGLVFAASRYPRSGWVIAGVVLHMAALLPVFVTERYRLAAVPGLLLLASIGLVDLWETLVWRAQGWWRWAVSYCLMAVGAVWVVSIPHHDESLWSLDYYNTGIKSLETGNLDRAQRKLELAFAYVPDNSEINFSLGNLWLKKHDRARAKRFYYQAIGIDPESLGALNNLAVLEIQDKNWKLAKALLNCALRVEPDDAKMRYILAFTKYNSGDVDGAKAELARALTLRPNQPEFNQLQDDILAGRPPKPFPIAP